MRSTSISRTSCNGAVKGGLVPCCMSFTSRGACEDAANRLSAQAVGTSTSAPLYSCPAKFSLATRNTTEHSGDCGESRQFLRFRKAFGPVALAFGGPQSAKAAAIAAKAAAKPRSRRVRRARAPRRRDLPPRAQTSTTPHESDQTLAAGARLGERATNFATTGMVIRLVNQDLPTEFSIGSQGNGGTIRKIYLEQNQCADIGAPLFEQYADIPESYSIFIPGKSGTGLQWVKPDLNSGWATLLAGTGPSCCFGQPNATGQWFYAFNPFQKDVPANFSKTYWTQQQQFMDNLPVEIPTNPPTVEIRPVPNYRGLGDVCLNNNGTAILGHPCQAGNNPNVANVQFLVMHTGANRKTSGPFPPRIWSRTDCMRVGAVYPAGYPSDVNMMRPRGQVPTAVLGPAFRKLEPISDTIKVNMTMCTIAAKPCMVYIGTLRDAARMINSGEASFHWIQYFMNMPGVPDTIMDMISDTLETLTEMLVDMGIELGSTVAEMIEAINAVDPDLSEAFAGIGENDLWDMVGKTAETTDFRRSFQIFTDMDIDAVEGIDYVTGASMGSLFAGSETDDLAEGTTAEDAGVDAAADDTTMEIIEPFMDAAVL